MTLKFVEKSHAYYLDGKRIPGVTTLLNKGLPKPALVYWSSKMVAEFVADNPDQVEQLRGMGRGPMVAALKGVPWQVRDTAAIRGTDIHALAERIIHGEAVEVPEYLCDYVDGYVRLLEAYDIQPILTEQPVAHRDFRYGGKFDAIVEFGRGPWKGRRSVVDWKSSKGVYGTVCLQVAAYSSAQFYAPEPEQELPLPEIDCTGVVHIEEGASTFYPLSKSPDEIAEAFKVFRHVQYLASKTEWIEGLIGTPWESEQDVA